MPPTHKNSKNYPFWKSPSKSTWVKTKLSKVQFVN